MLPKYPAYTNFIVENIKKRSTFLISLDILLVNIKLVRGVTNEEQ
jgi:hypothetical protein